MIETGHCAFLQAVDIYYRVLFLSNTDNRIVVGQNFKLLIERVLESEVTLQMAGLLLQHIDDLTMGVRTRQYFARCLATKLRTPAPLNYVELKLLHQKLKSFLRGNLPEVRTEADSWVAGTVVGTLPDNEIRTAVITRLAVTNGFNSTSLQEVNQMLNCVRMEAQLTRQNVQAAFAALLQPNLQLVILEGLKGSEPFVCQSLGCLINIYLACSRPHLLRYVTPEVFLNPDLWLTVFNLQLNDFESRRLQAKTLAILACNVPSFSGYLLQQPVLLQQLLNRLGTSTSVSGLPETLQLIKLFMKHCKTTANPPLTTNAALTKVFQDFSTVSFSSIFSLIERFQQQEIKLALEVLAECLSVFRTVSTQVRNNLYKIISALETDTANHYWSEILIIILRALESRNGEVSKIVLNHPSFLKFAGIHMSSAQSGVHLLMMEIIHEASKVEECCLEIVGAPQLLMGLGNASALNISCTSAILSDIMYNLTEKLIGGLSRASAQLYQIDTLRILVNLLECASKPILFYAYYRDQLPHPNFYIVQNCVAVLALLMEAASQGPTAAQNAEALKTMIPANVADDLRRVFQGLFQYPQTQFLESQLREEVHIRRNGPAAKLYVVMAEIFKTFRRLTLKESNDFIGKGLRDAIYELIYRFIPKSDLDKDGIQVFVTVELKPYGVPLEAINNTLIKHQTVNTTYQPLIKEISFKLGMEIDQFVLKDDLNRTIADDAILQQLLNRVFAEHRVQPQFTLRLNFERKEIPVPIYASESDLVALRRYDNYNSYVPARTAYFPEPTRAAQYRSQVAAARCLLCKGPGVVANGICAFCSKPN